MTVGSLAVVGTGIWAAGQLTPEAGKAIREADKVVHAVTRSARPLIEALCPDSEDMTTYYTEGELREVTLRRMTDTIVRSVEDGHEVCAVFYGHPGVFCTPAHAAIRRVRALGGKAHMLPAISSHDSLFAEIGIDPGAGGCQIYEATDFLTRRTHDVTTPLILYQPEVVGDPGFHVGPWPQRGVPVLVELLADLYSADHSCVLYRASSSPLWPSEIQYVTVGALGESPLTMHTLFVPAKGEPERDTVMKERIGGMVGGS